MVDKSDLTVLPKDLIEPKEASEEIKADLEEIRVDLIEAREALEEIELLETKETRPSTWVWTTRTPRRVPSVVSKERKWHFDVCNGWHLNNSLWCGLLIPDDWNLVLIELDFIQNVQRKHFREDDPRISHNSNCCLHRFYGLQATRCQKGGRVQNQAGTSHEEKCKDAILHYVLSLSIRLQVQRSRKLYHTTEYSQPRATSDCSSSHLEGRVLVKVRKGPLPPSLQRRNGQVQIQCKK